MRSGYIVLAVCFLVVSCSDVHSNAASRDKVDLHTTINPNGKFLSPNPKPKIKILDRPRTNSVLNPAFGHVGFKTCHNTNYKHILRRTCLVQFMPAATTASSLNKDVVERTEELDSSFEDRTNYDLSIATSKATKEGLRRRLEAYIKLREQDLLNLKTFPLEDVCPYASIRVKSVSSGADENITCIPKKQNRTTCERIAQIIGKPREFSPKSCQRDSTTEAAPLCWFQNDQRSHADDVAGLRCVTSRCQPNPIYVGVFNTSMGKVLAEQEWPSYQTGDELERGIGKVMRMKYSNQFRFCFLKCAPNNDSKATLKQMLVFPPIVNNSTNSAVRHRININIVVEDAVSRNHFYRSLPKTVDALRGIVYNPFVSATVLDFELYQSYDSSTHSNVQRLFGGRRGKSKPLIDEIKLLYTNFKDAGYRTIFQEDACWFEGFGSLLRPKIVPETANDNLTTEWSYFMNNLLQNESIFDTFGVGFSSCKVLEDLGDVNIFNGGKLPALCFNGRHLSSYYLETVERYFELHEAKQAPVFSYLHLNSGHEHTGKRIINDDEHLASFLKDMATRNDTLTIFLSDHGGKTSDYAIRTAEGLKEIYKPFLFVIIPEKVAGILGNERMENLIRNQRRLVVLEDLHLSLMDLAEKFFKSSNGTENSVNQSKENYKSVGLFGKIPVTRNCSDLRLSADAVCQCEGEEVVGVQDELFLNFLANFAVGEINNLVQSQYVKGSSISGKEKVVTESEKQRRCQKYNLQRVERVRCKVNDARKLCTFTVVVDTLIKKSQEQLFEVTVGYSLLQDHGLDLVKLTRLSRYSEFKPCVDNGVDPDLCTCYINQPVTVRNSAYIWDIFSHYMFTHPSKIRKLHGSCLYVILSRRERAFRNAEGKDSASVYEILNVCSNKIFNVTVTDTSFVRKPFILSKSLPLDVVIYPNTIHHVLSAFCTLPSGMFAAKFHVDVQDVT